MLIKRLLLIIISLLLLTSLEAVSYFFIPDAKLTELESILRVLEADSQLIWKQAPHLNTRFHGINITTNSWGIRGKEISLKKEGNHYRIACLGPSSAFGWGVGDGKTYSYLLEEIIRREHADSRDIEVINAGVIGYSSFQGKLFLKKDILRLKPDMIIVSYLINDIDKYRFYRSNGEADNDLPDGNRALIYLENIFGKSRMYTALKRIIFYFRNRNLEYGGEVYSENRRVSEADYSSNLNEFIDIAKANNIKVVFINTPIGIKNSAIRSVDKAQQDKASKSVETALELGRLRKYASAIVELKKALGYNPYSAKAFFYLGIYYFKDNDTKSARFYLHKSKEMELLECVRLSKVYNEIMSQVASDRNIPLVDAVSAFDEFNQKTAGSLFINPEQDFVHPNMEGHRIISREIYKTLLKSKLLHLAGPL